MFDCDVRNLPWLKYIRYYVRGLAIWALKEDQVEPQHGFDQIMIKNKKAGDTLQFSLSVKANVIDKSSSVYEKRIIDEKRFYEFIEKDVSNTNTSQAIRKAHNIDKRAIQKELLRLRCNIQKGPSQGLFYFLSKVMNHLIEGLHLDRESLKNIN